MTNDKINEIKSKTGTQLKENLRYLKKDNIDLFLPNRLVLKKRKIIYVCEYINIGRKITRTTIMKKISQHLER